MRKERKWIKTRKREFVKEEQGVCDGRIRTMKSKGREERSLGRGNKDYMMDEKGVRRDRK